LKETKKGRARNKHANGSEESSRIARQGMFKEEVVSTNQQARRELGNSGGRVELVRKKLLKEARFCFEKTYRSQDTKTSEGRGRGGGKVGRSSSSERETYGEVGGGVK